MSSKARELANLGNAYSDGALSNRNKVINGAFQIWQRSENASGVGNAGYIAADRWTAYIDTSSTVYLSKQEMTTDDAGLDASLRYYCKFDWLGTGAASLKILGQRIEDVRTLANQTVTLSFYGRTEQADDVTVSVYQNFGSGGSTYATAVEQLVDLSTSWSRYSVTFTMPSISGKTIGSGSFIDLQFRFGPATLNSYFEVTGVQLEVGDTATPFEHRSYGQELALCQRYFCHSNPSVGANDPIGSFICYAENTSRMDSAWHFPVRMRATPTITKLVDYIIRQNNNQTITSASFDSTNPESTWILSAGTFVDQSVGRIYATSPAPTFSADAEL